MKSIRDMTVIHNVFRSGFEQTQLKWQPWTEPGREGVDNHVLWAPSGDGAEDSTGLLVRFAPGAHSDIHRHLGFELMVILDGVLCNDEGDEYPAGTLILEYPNSVHQMSSKTGATLIGIRTGPAEPAELPERVSASSAS